MKMLQSAVRIVVYGTGLILQFYSKFIVTSQILGKNRGRDSLRNRRVPCIAHTACIFTCKATLVNESFQIFL